MKVKNRPEKFALRVIRGGYAPADEYTAARLRDKGHRINDIVFAQMSKPRNPKFHNLAHKFGELVSENIDSFMSMDAHKVLKRLQIEANIGCEEVAANIAGHGMIILKIPRSLSFESMEEGEFQEVMRGMCRHVAEFYWPMLSEDEIAEMAGVMIGE
ncbi:MAG: hypothetical protein GWN00_19935 [Aliifodinibius sp.]|nr:hypothetical protein [Fodinibius sp.]NIY26992.1 hypothetical protein [Fodinibius sp.]